jgi:hypothetical protein
MVIIIPKTPKETKDMRLNADYIVYDEEEGSYIPVTNKSPFKDIVRNDGTAAYVIENLVDETTASNIVNKMVSEFAGFSRKTAEHDVANVIYRLHEIGALVG